MPTLHIQLSILKIRAIGKKMNLSTISNNIYYVCANLFLGLFAHREISNVHAKESPCEFKNIEPVQFDTLESIYSITSTLVIV